MKRSSVMLLAGLLLFGCGDGREGRSGTTRQQVDKWESDVERATTPARPVRLFYHAAHQRLCDRQTDPNVLMLGNSITDGWDGAGRQVWQQRLAPLGAANYGISADRTEWMLWRLGDGELDGLAPDVVVLMIGTNNLKSGPLRMSPEAAAAGAEAVLDLLAEKLPDAKVLLMSVLPRQPKYDWMPAAVKRTNELLSEAASEREHVRFVDISGRFVDEGGDLRPELYQGDLLHLSKAGYRLWAQAIEPPLKRLLGP